MRTRTEISCQHLVICYCFKACLYAFFYLWDFSMNYYPQLLQSCFTIASAYQLFDLLFLCAYYAPPWWVFLQTYKDCQSAPQSSKAPVLQEESCGPRMVGCGCTEIPKSTPSYNYKHAHRQTHTGYIMAHFLVCLCPMCEFFGLFICNSCTPLAHMCLVLHHYTERRGSTDFWAKTMLLDVQICLHCCGNSSQAASFTLYNTHRQKHKNTDTENKQKGADQSIATCSVCLHV